jgi:curli production assembly/transport component CsgG
MATPIGKWASGGWVVKGIVGTTALALIVLGLGACTPGTPELLEQAPRVTDPSATAVELETLPPPRHKVDIAVYKFPDLTGKNEPNDSVAVFSRAVTQGGASFVIDALKRAGGGKWFNVVNRTNLTSLLQERQLITVTRKEIDGASAKPLPPLHFAGLLIDGGIIGFDANTVTGGIGANFLGIGGDTKYQRDVVTVGMRVTSVQNGEVLLSVTTTKTVYSVAVDINEYKYVALNKLLQIEGGFTRNEPTQLAVRQAIDLAVYATIIEGARQNLWSFTDPRQQKALIDKYLREDKVEPSVREAVAPH